MRILLVHDEPIDVGYGAESYVRRLAEGLHIAGDDVGLIVGEVRHLGVRRALDLWDRSAQALVRDRAEDFRPDVLHHHNISRELSASVLTAVPTVPQVMTVHDLRLLGAREHTAATPRGLVEMSTTTLVRRVARRRLTATIGVSERVSAELRRHDFPNVHTVGVPVVAPVAPVTPVHECHDLAMVARLAPDKGVDVVIEAFGRADVDGARLLIAGDGPSRRSLEAAAARLGGRVQFLGRLGEAEVSALLGSVRAVVVASLPKRRPEGSSLALVEAAAHARPVIASDDPAVREIAEQLGGAVLVPAGDVAALSAAMRSLLLDGHRAAELGARGRGTVMQTHSVAAVTAATRAVYADVLAAGDA
jgi:glycosyltransferase involved in cell wall biosynthesis